MSDSKSITSVDVNCASLSPTAHFTLVSGCCAPVAYDWQHSAQSDWCWRPRGERAHPTGEQRGQCCLFKSLTSRMSVLSPRSQITTCCQTRGACQNSSECVCKRATKTQGTSRLSSTCRCSICPLTLYPKSSGENSEYNQCFTTLLFFFSSAKKKKKCSSCSAYKELNVKDEPLQLITPQFETPLPQLQPAVSFLYQLKVSHI